MSVSKTYEELTFEVECLRDRVRILEAQLARDAETSSDVWRVRAWQGDSILLGYIMACAGQSRGLQRQARKLRRKDREIARMQRRLTTDQREALKREAMHLANNTKRRQT